MGSEQTILSTRYAPGYAPSSIHSFVPNGKRVPTKPLAYSPACASIIREDSNHAFEQIKLTDQNSENQSGTNNDFSGSSLNGRQSGHFSKQNVSPLSPPTSVSLRSSTEEEVVSTHYRPYSQGRTTPNKTNDTFSFEGSVSEDSEAILPSLPAISSTYKRFAPGLNNRFSCYQSPPSTFSSPPGSSFAISDENEKVMTAAQFESLDMQASVKDQSGLTEHDREYLMTAIPSLERNSNAVPKSSVKEGTRQPKETDNRVMEENKLRILNGRESKNGYQSKRKLSNTFSSDLPNSPATGRQSRKRGRLIIQYPHKKRKGTFSVERAYEDNIDETLEYINYDSMDNINCNAFKYKPSGKKRSSSILNSGPKFNEIKSGEFQSTNPTLDFGIPTPPSSSQMYIPSKSKSKAPHSQSQTPVEIALDENPMLGALPNAGSFSPILDPSFSIFSSIPDLNFVEGMPEMNFGFEANEDFNSLLKSMSHLHADPLPDWNRFSEEFTRRGTEELLCLSSIPKFF
jgi:hypothetical protein